MAGAALAIAATAIVAGAAVSIKGQLDAAKSAKNLAKAKAEQLRQQDLASQEARAANAKIQNKNFRIAAGKNEAEASFAGAEGFGDIFRADVVTFEAEQLILDFNRDVFGVNQQTNANLAIFEGDVFAASQVSGAIGTGFAAVATVASLGASYNARTPTQTPTTQLGGGGSSPGYNAPYSTSAKTSTFA